MPHKNTYSGRNRNYSRPSRNAPTSIQLILRYVKDADRVRQMRRTCRCESTKCLQRPYLDPCRRRWFFFPLQKSGQPFFQVILKLGCRFVARSLYGHLVCPIHSGAPNSYTPASVVRKRLHPSIRIAHEIRCSMHSVRHRKVQLQTLDVLERA